MALGALLGPLYGGGFWVAFRQLAAVRPPPPLPPLPPAACEPCRPSACCVAAGHLSALVKPLTAGYWSDVPALQLLPLLFCRPPPLSPAACPRRAPLCCRSTT